MGKKHKKNNKDQHAWADALTMAAVSMQHRIDWHVAQLKGWDTDKAQPDDDEWDAVDSILAIEEEWIVDADLRRELSAIQFTDD